MEGCLKVLKLQVGKQLSASEAAKLAKQSEIDAHLKECKSCREFHTSLVRRVKLQEGSDLFDAFVEERHPSLRELGKAITGEIKTQFKTLASLKPNEWSLERPSGVLAALGMSSGEEGSAVSVASQLALLAVVSEASGQEQRPTVTKKTREETIPFQNEGTSTTAATEIIASELAITAVVALSVVFTKRILCCHRPCDGMCAKICRAVPCQPTASPASCPPKTESRLAFPARSDASCSPSTRKRRARPSSSSIGDRSDSS